MLKLINIIAVFNLILVLFACIILMGDYIDSRVQAKLFAMQDYMPQVYVSEMK